MCDVKFHTTVAEDFLQTAYNNIASNGLQLEMNCRSMSITVKQKLSFHNGSHLVVTSIEGASRWDIKDMLTVLFDCEGVVHHEYAPLGQTIIKEYYFDVFPE